MALAELCRASMGQGGRWVVILNDPRLTAMCILFARAAQGGLSVALAATWEEACRLLGVEMEEGLLEGAREIFPLAGRGVLVEGEA